MTLDHLRRNRNLLFWALHTLGWSAYLITQYLGALLYEKPTSYIKVVLAAAAGGFLLSAPLRYLYRRLWGQRFVVVVPAVLFASPEVITAEVEKILSGYGNGSGHIFNLGHGLTPEIPPAHVEALVEMVHRLGQTKTQP